MKLTRMSDVAQRMAPTPMSPTEASRLHQNQLEALRTARARQFDHADIEDLEQLVVRSEAEIYNVWGNN